jgi:hypothetical protein
MAWLDRIIHRSVKNSVDKAVASKSFYEKLDKLIIEELTRNHRFQFVKAMQVELVKHAPTMSNRESWDLAKTTLIRFLRAEKCEFGDPRFDWSKQGAITMMHECELQYWDA